MGKEVSSRVGEIRTMTQAVLGWGPLGHTEVRQTVLCRRTMEHQVVLTVWVLKEVLRTRRSQEDTLCSASLAQGLLK